MTCTHCCGADDFFDNKGAQKDLKRYRSKGPNKTTKKLLSVLKTEGVRDLSLLDIGGGIGVIEHELLKIGLSQSTDVDASKAYITIAKDLMMKNGFESRMTFLNGDFNDFHENIQQHDIVTLEKVVCCYPYADQLIKHSAEKAVKYYGLVYPMDNLFARLINKIGHLYFWIKKNSFRTFIHSEDRMHELIKKQGLERIYYGKVFPWRIAMYKRIQEF